MVRRKCYFVVSIIFNILSLLLFLLFDRSNYIYPKFSLQFKQLVLLIVMHGIIVGTEILVFLLIFKFKKLTVIRIFSTILVIVISFYSLLFLHIGLIGQMWSSEIDEYDDFRGFDSHMSFVVNSPGISLNDIVCGDVIHAENFYYSSSMLPFHIDFEIRGDFYYSKEHYEKVRPVLVAYCKKYNMTKELKDSIKDLEKDAKFY